MTIRQTFLIGGGMFLVVLFARLVRGWLRGVPYETSSESFAQSFHFTSFRRLPSHGDALVPTIRMVFTTRHTRAYNKWICKTRSNK